MKRARVAAAAAVKVIGAGGLFVLRTAAGELHLLVAGGGLAGPASGLWMIYPPLALIVGGGAVFCITTYGALRRTARTKEG